MKTNFVLSIIFFSTILGISAQGTVTTWDNLGLEIETALNAQDGSFDAYVDLDAFARRIVVPNPANPSIKKLNKTMRAAIDGPKFSFSSILTKHKIDYLYQYIGSRADSSLLFRQWNFEEGGFNYFTTKLTVFNDEWKVIDLYVLMSGDYLSTTLKNTMYMPMVIRILSDDKKGKTRYANFEIQVQAARLLREKEYERAYTKISGIPFKERTREQQLFKINVAGFCEEDDNYYKSIAEFEEKFPSDPSLNLIILDKLIMDEKYKSAIESLENLKPHALNDPYLSYYSALIYILWNKYAKAEKAIQVAIAAEPYEEYFWTWVDILDARKNYRGCVDVIATIKSAFGFSKEEINPFVQERYSKLARSKPYTQWLKNN